MIYLFPSLDTFTEEALARTLSLLPPSRRKYAQHFRRIEDQKRTAIGYLLLVYGLRKEYGLKMLPDISISPSGKPRLTGKGMPFFSISHSGSYVGCALHHSEIGLDIQQTIPLRPAVVRRICTPEEKISILTEEDFCCLWTKKESAVKLTGEGITNDFRSILLRPDIHTVSLPLENGKYYLSYSFYI